MRMDGAIDLAAMGTPGTPGTGRHLLYPKSDGLWYTKTPDGIESLVGPATGGDTNWANLTNEGSSGTVRWKCKSGTVWIEGSVNHSSIAHNGTFTIVTAANGVPAGYRPGQSLWSDVARMGAGTGLGRMGRFTDGSLVIQNSAGVAAASTQFVVSYPLE